MQTIKERMVVVWNKDGSFRGASLDELISYEDGSTRNAQRPLTEADADALVGSIDADVLVQFDAAKATIETLTKERDDAQAESSKHETTATEMLGKVMLLQSEKTLLTTRLSDVSHRLNALESTIWDKRKIDPGAWYARLSMDHVLAITEAATKDPIANSFVTVLKESRQLQRDDPTYRMSLDNPIAQAGIAYLSGQPIPIDANGNTATIKSPVFTAEEAVTMLADSRADEQ